jgi:hypothetical protein
VAWESSPVEKGSHVNLASTMPLSSDDPMLGQPPAITPHPELSGVPQFSTAEYVGTERCRICSRLLDAEYYRVNGQMACKVCALQASEGQPTNSHAALVRGAVYGTGAAILGSVLYAAVTSFGFTIGYLSLAVGWLIGKAMMKGSNGVGGRMYQMISVLLTYCAICMAPALAILPAIYKHASSVRSWGAMLGGLALVGLESPVARFSRNPASAAIGLLILFIGLSIAWQLTRARPLAVTGPYSASTP